MGVGGSDRDDANGKGLGQAPSTAPPPSVRAAILARVVQQTVGGVETPLLDGRYRLLTEIGRGGAGTVWKAELLPLGRLVAVKLLRPGVASSSNVVSRLMREAMTVSKLGHEHIVQVNDVGTDENGSPYIAMELVEGESLAQLVTRRGPLPWSDVAEIATQICDALSAAHAVGIVHRDVKPANVIAAKRDDGRWRCKLLDFGLCTAGRDTAMLTAAGVLLGTPGYAAPEQIRGEVVDGRADLYGLACVMVELLTGHPAFGGASRQEVVSHQLGGRRCGELDRLELPASVVALVDRGLSAVGSERHDDPASFAAAIGNAGRTEHLPTPDPGTMPSTTLRGRGLVRIATALVCAGIVAMVVAAAMAPSSSETDAAVSTSTAPRPVATPPTRARPAPAPRAPLDSAPRPDHIPKASAPPVTSEPQSPVKPVKRRRSRPRRPTEPKAPAAKAQRAYPDGIRDPFALR